MPRQIGSVKPQIEVYRILVLLLFILLFIYYLFIHGLRIVCPCLAEPVLSHWQASVCVCVYMDGPVKEAVLGAHFGHILLIFCMPGGARVTTGSIFEILTS
jgi:hypothetical protein